MNTTNSPEILSLGSLEALPATGLAVTAGKAVLGALETSEAVEIQDVTLDEAQWSEMTAYLARRGVSVRDNVAKRAE